MLLQILVQFARFILPSIWLSLILLIFHSFDDHGCRSSKQRSMKMHFLEDDQRKLLISDDQDGDKHNGGRWTSKTSDTNPAPVHVNILLYTVLGLLSLVAVFLVCVLWLRLDSGRLALLVPLESSYIERSSLVWWIIEWTALPLASLPSYLGALAATNRTDSILMENDRSLILITNPPPPKTLNDSPIRCSHYSCVNIEPCTSRVPSYNPGDFRLAHRRHMKVYVYPVFVYFLRQSTGRLTPVRNSRSRQFLRMLQSIINSIYFTNDPEEACLFVINLDLLDFHRSSVSPEAIESLLWSLPYFKASNGSNHLIFSFFPHAENGRDLLDLNLGQTMLAVAGLDNVVHRLYFDVVTPVYSLYAQLYGPDGGGKDLQRPTPLKQLARLEALERRWTLVAVNLAQGVDLNLTLQRLESIYSNRVLLLESSSGCAEAQVDSEIRSLYVTTAEQNILEQYCAQVACNRERRLGFCYLDILHRSSFSLITSHSQQHLLADSLMSGAIPVILVDNLVLPFSDRIDWRLASVRIWEHEAPELLDRLDAMSSAHRTQLRANGFAFWWRYFRSPGGIALETLSIINDRFFARPQQVVHIGREETLPARLVTPMTPHFYREAGLHFMAPKASYLQTAGFTAVVLAYNRLESLFEIVSSLSRVTSCVKIIVVWNNLDAAPPPVQRWPLMAPGVSVQIVRSEANRIGNRFFPFRSIETEAIFSIDDDITMLNADEVEFAFQTWCEFPDRLVGFPSRLHRWNNMSRAWVYDSEWRNQFSLILTGAAFYHRSYNFVYTYVLPSQLREWIDEQRNCEDIAMNFLVANLTCKAPIKVTPRKKFKCPECKAHTILSADALQHLRLRSHCVHRFAEAFGFMPLKAVEFRSNPVLFRDNIPEKFKHFNLIGNL